MTETRTAPCAALGLLGDGAYALKSLFSRTPQGATA